MSQAPVRRRAGWSALALGDEQGLCCLIEVGLTGSKVIRIYSASKLLTAYVFLRLVEDRRLKLQTRAADVLFWWNASGGGCHNVTVGHLLLQVSSMNMYPGGLGKCTQSTELGCAMEAYRSSCSHRALGSSFAYAETNWHVLGAIALAVTGLPTFNAVFRKYLAGPLRISESCAFDYPNLSRSDPGSGARCSIVDYARFLRAALDGKLVKPRLWKWAEMPQTAHTGSQDPSLPPWEYGLGQWVECTDATGVKVSSVGAAGWYPWIFRGGKEGHGSHWGILGRLEEDTGDVSRSIAAQAFPLAVRAIQHLPEQLPRERVRVCHGDCGNTVQRAMDLLHEDGGPTLALGSALAACLPLAALGLLWRLCFSRRGGSTAYMPVSSHSADESGQKIGADADVMGSSDS